MAAAEMIINDDVEGADVLLLENDSSFHKLGRGVTRFLMAVMGFEQDIMKDAGDRLSDAETSAWNDLKRAQKDGGSQGGTWKSSIYPVGSEFALCQAEAQLMNAVLGVLNESLTEAIKGFYKLRKAYIALDAIMAAERKYMDKRGGITTGSSTSISSAGSRNAMPGGFDKEERPSAGSSAPSTRNASTTNVDSLTNQHVAEPAKSTVAEDEDEDEDEDLEFVDAEETPYVEGIERKLQDLSLQSSAFPGTSTQGLEGPDSDMFTNPLDIFIHSGTNLCHGLLLLIISMVPPAFNKLLYIIGFKGDRERGIQMLWQSTKFPNINGAVAGLVLLGHYNVITGFCDILPPDEPETAVPGGDILGYPKARCEALLADMTTRYPESKLWRLEEARMRSANGDLQGCIDTLNTNSNSKMKQINALAMFEKSLNAMYLHNYALCAESFITCVSMNTWSHALYYYVAGSAQVELYRIALTNGSNAAMVQEHKKKATEYLRKAPSVAGKKKFMSKQLPFDTFVMRKVQKWEERARDWGVDFVDAVGVSPIEEMIYLWNGTKRMAGPQLQDSLKALSWSRTTKPDKHQGNLDEEAIHALLESTLMRHLGRYDEARQILQQGIIRHDKSVTVFPL